MLAIHNIRRIIAMLSAEKVFWVNILENILGTLSWTTTLENFLGGLPWKTLQANLLGTPSWKKLSWRALLVNFWKSALGISLGKFIGKLSRAKPSGNWLANLFWEMSVNKWLGYVLVWEVYFKALSEIYWTTALENYREQTLSEISLGYFLKNHS